MHHHGDGLVGVEGGFFVEGGEAEECAFGVFGAALADEPPGGFGREEDADKERDGPHPLECVGDLGFFSFVAENQAGSTYSICPLICTA